jgi:hypothetical protein
VVLDSAGTGVAIFSYRTIVPQSYAYRSPHHTQTW